MLVVVAVRMKMVVIIWKGFVTHQILLR
jgi:hypothetical protein